MSLGESRAPPAAELSCQPRSSAHFQLGFLGGVLGSGLSQKYLVTQASGPAELGGRPVGLRHQQREGPRGLGDYISVAQTWTSVPSLGRYRSSHPQLMPSSPSSWLHSANQALSIGQRGHLPGWCLQARHGGLRATSGAQSSWAAQWMHRVDFLQKPGDGGEERGRGGGKRGEGRKGARPPLALLSSAVPESLSLLPEQKLLTPCPRLHL